MSQGEDQAYSAEQVMRATGLTYRQLDHAVRKGFVPHPAATPGSGRRRTFTDAQLTQLAQLAELLRAGLTLKTAAYIATTNPEYERGAVQIRVDEKKIEETLQNHHNQQQQPQHPRGNPIP